jgi:hypothetical protein
MMRLREDQRPGIVEIVIGERCRNPALLLSDIAYGRS